MMGTLVTNQQLLPSRTSPHPSIRPAIAMGAAIAMEADRSFEVAFSRTCPNKDAFLNIISENVEHYYLEDSNNSNDNKVWNKIRRQKLLDLGHACMRFIVASTSHEPLIGFISFMYTSEPDVQERQVPVIYIYEFHVVKRYQGIGLGQALFAYLLALVRAEQEFRGAEKVMLTVHKKNLRAASFYMKILGFAIDPISPSQILVADVSKDYDYEILFMALS